MIADAVKIFLDDANSRGLKKPTQQKLKRLCEDQLHTWAKSESLLYLNELTTEPSPTSQNKRGDQWPLGRRRGRG